MGNIWILAESQEQTLELLNKGQELAEEFGGKLAAFAAGRTAADDYITHGADEVYLLPSLPADEVWGAYANAIADEAKKQLPEVILIAGTMRGREMAARLAQKLNTGLCSGCINMKFNKDSGQLEMERLIYGGAAVQTVVCSSIPRMATIPPRTFEPAAGQTRHQGQIIEMTGPIGSTVKVKEIRPAVQAEGNLAAAKVVVCVGRGLEQETDLDLIRQLAAATDGQIGCTRPLSEELHWLQEDACIGLSGQQVKPELYIGIGVSGQIQHITGIRDSKTIMAINRDENAPIFQVADFGIVGDLYDIVPQLIKGLEKRR